MQAQIQKETIQEIKNLYSFLNKKFDVFFELYKKDEHNYLADEITSVILRTIQDIDKLKEDYK